MVVEFLKSTVTHKSCVVNETLTGAEKLFIHCLTKEAKRARGPGEYVPYLKSGANTSLRADELG